MNWQVVPMPHEPRAMCGVVRERGEDEMHPMAESGAVDDGSTGGF